MSPDPREAVIRTIVMPKDLNALGTVFGGVILSLIDQAAAEGARMHKPLRYVTVAMDQVEFKKPVHVGDLVSCYADIERVGRTSITVRVEVEALRHRDRETVVPVTEATVVMVAVDRDGEPVAIAEAELDA